ncbi:IclR family transcriptional regulator [Ruegeria sp. 2205SS24-7]|uniref:IclR family transcriptional regulator n=1 Tax=Ruegeria discodermiae TaxID=3064389 RepID=UPI002740B118|nr:IclR family transcriptional regulator [Ruegeria sp. 2205SS24-7]MDP5218925.1 IclR family transcriptional regulator [Ruegeria sp. 2205SS24-7]
MSDERTATRRGRPRTQLGESKSLASPVVALDRGIRILTILANEGSATLAEIAKSTDIPAATAHRIVATLEARGMVSQDLVSGKWRVGPQAFRIGSAFEEGSNLLEVAPPLMRRLSKETGETANLAVEQGNELIYLIQVESENPIRASIKNGTSAYFHTSGVGKAIMAYMTRSKLVDLLGTFSLVRQTDNSITEAEKLLIELENIHSRGWALDDEERFLGMRCIAAPVFDSLGNVIAGVSISGPISRFPDDKLETLATAVQNAAASMSENLKTSQA